MPYCYNCEKRLGSQGVAGHRAMHRRRKEDVTIQLKSGLFTYGYSDEKED